MPIVNVLTIVRWRGRNGYGQPAITDRDREQHRVDGLGDEQVRRPLDVGDDPAALGDDAGHRRELAVEQHELRDRAGRRRRRSPSRRRCRRPSAQRVVHAVAGHRDDVALRLQRADHRPLLVRRDPAEHRVRARAPRRARRWSSGSSRASNGVVGVGQADPRARPPPTVRGLSPEMTLQRHALLVRSSASVSAASGRTFSSNSTSATGCRPAGSASPVERRVGCARAAARAGPSAASSSARAAHGRRRSSASTISGAPSTHEPVAVEASPRSTCGPTRTGPRRCAPSRRRRERRGERDRAWRCGSRRRRARRAPPSRSPHRPSASSGSSSSNTIVALGERAGLVEAHDVDAREPLDRGQLLHQHLAPGERDRGDPNAMLVSSTSPSGTIADHAGDRRRASACVERRGRASWLQSSSADDRGSAPR